MEQEQREEVTDKTEIEEKKSEEETSSTEEGVSSETSTETRIWGRNRISRGDRRELGRIRICCRRDRGNNICF